MKCAGVTFNVPASLTMVNMSTRSSVVRTCHSHTASWNEASLNEMVTGPSMKTFPPQPTVPNLKFKLLIKILT